MFLYNSFKIYSFQILLKKDTLRNFVSIYNLTENSWLKQMSFTDKNIIACKSANFLRNFLRLTSAYIVVAFTIQRLWVVLKPLKAKNKTKKSAFKTIGAIMTASLVLNSWSPFFFYLETAKTNYTYCDVKNYLKYQYFIFNCFFISISIVIPSIIILICNFLIIKKNAQKNFLKKRSIESNSRSRKEPKSGRSVSQSQPVLMSSLILTENTNKQLVSNRLSEQGYLEIIFMKKYIFIIKYNFFF